MRRAPADMAVYDDQSRAIAGLLERAKARADQVQIVGVGNVRDVPSVSGEPRSYIFRERQRSAAFDRDPIAVVDPAEIREFQVSGERRRLA